jgi:hypothetical protein
MSHWTPKIHPASRELGPEDPMELTASAVEGDPDVMLEAMVQEFLGMGWEVEPLLALFRSPGYPVLNALADHYGDELAVRVEKLASRMGVWRFRETFVEEPDDDALPEPVLYQISPLDVERPRHASGL